VARIRSIKPEFFTNDEIGALTPLARLLFVGLWTQADREGRLKDRPSRLKITLLPYDRANVDALLTTLVESGHIERYEVGGERFIQVVNFSLHQCPNSKEPDSTIPAPCKHSASMVLAQGEGKGRERKGKEREGRAREAWQECFDAYPLHRYRDKASDAYDAALADGASHDDLLAACRNVPRDTRQSFHYFLADGTWRDHIPRSRKRCTNPDCQNGVVYDRATDSALPCPECGR